MNLLPFNLEKALNGAKVVHNGTPENIGAFYQFKDKYVFVDDTDAALLTIEECEIKLRLLEETEERWAWADPSFGFKTKEEALENSSEISKHCQLVKFTIVKP